MFCQFVFSVSYLVQSGVAGSSPARLTKTRTETKSFTLQGRDQIARTVAQALNRHDYALQLARLLQKFLLSMFRLHSRN